MGLVFVHAFAFCPSLNPAPPLDAKLRLENTPHKPLKMSDPGDFDVVPENVYQVACLVDPKTDASWIRVRADTSKAPPVSRLPSP